jgi:type I restriction enzyme R subunit
MAFNELNSVEHFIIHNLTGVNLNNVHTGMVREGPVEYSGVKWKYVQSELLQRENTDVLVEKELINALCRLNPEIAAQPERAEEVIRKLRAIILSVGNVGLVRANEEFARWLRGEVTLPFGKNEKHVQVRLIDFENLNKPSS